MPFREAPVGLPRQSVQDGHDRCGIRRRQHDVVIVEVRFGGPDKELAEDLHEDFQSLRRRGRAPPSFPSYSGQAALSEGCLCQLRCIRTRRLRRDRAEALFQVDSRASGGDGKRHTSRMERLKVRLTHAERPRTHRKYPHKHWVNMAEACGSRMYPHAEFQALTRNPVEQKDGQKRIKERLTFPQCSLVSREASKSPTCGIFAHAAPQNVG